MDDLGSPFDRPHSKGPLLKTADMADLFSPTEDGGSQKYYYETARVPSGDSSYDFGRHHPRVWSALCQTQIFRIVYCLVHNIHPYFFYTNMGSFCKFDYVETLEPPQRYGQAHEHEVLAVCEQEDTELSRSTYRPRQESPWCGQGVLQGQLLGSQP